jgi:hypothetical protein
MKKFTVTFLLLVLLKVLSAQGTDLWAISANGGINRNGLLFRFSSIDSGQLVPVLSFDTVGARVRDTTSNSSGWYDLEYLEGSLYGIANSIDSNTFLLFRYNIEKSTYVRLASFPKSWKTFKISKIILTDKVMYGASLGGGNYQSGFIFSYNLVTNELKKIYDFEAGFGRGDQLSPLTYANSRLFGLSDTGGSHNNGFLFSYGIDDETFTIHYHLDYKPLSFAPMFLDFTGTLCGTLTGGSSNLGLIFSFNISTSKFIVVKDLENTGPLTINHITFTSCDGYNLYGTSWGGYITSIHQSSYQNGTILKYNIHTKLITVLKYMDLSWEQTGLAPQGVTKASNNMLYGFGNTGSDQRIISYNLNNNAFKKIGYLDYYQTPVAGNCSNSLPLDTASKQYILSSVIDDKTNILSVHIMPNPFSDKLVLKSNTDDSLYGSVTDVMGKEVVQLNLSSYQTSVVLTDIWASGLYFWKLSSNSGYRYYGKLLKKTN